MSLFYLQKYMCMYLQKACLMEEALKGWSSKKSEVLNQINIVYPHSYQSIGKAGSTRFREKHLSFSQCLKL